MQDGSEQVELTEAEQCRKVGEEQGLVQRHECRMHYLFNGDEERTADEIATICNASYGRYILQRWVDDGCEIPEELQGFLS